jgi:hypothetical protein
MGAVTRELVHPTQASRVRLRVYEPQTGGFLLTEERQGASTVISTLGLFDRREEALGQLEARATELVGQRYTPTA